MLRDLFLQACPIPTSARGLFTPHIKLQLSLARWRPFEGLVRAIASSEFT